MTRISDLNRAQRAFFGAGQTRPLAFRRAELERLRGALREYEPLLLAALREDLGKAEFEGYAAELGMLYGEIDEALRHLKKWARPRRARAPLRQFPARGRIYVEPLGVVLILSPWNYPLLLSLAPLVGAIAAGCCACLKPSPGARYGTGHWGYAGQGLPGGIRGGYCGERGNERGAFGGAVGSHLFYG